MSQKGLVAYFDILGYQNIIDKNLIEEVSKVVSHVLELPDAAKKELLTMVKIEESSLMGSLLGRINARVISDSIILILEIPEKADNRDTAIVCVLFLGYIAFLLKRAFEEGLPLRGVVDYGDFFLKENCFAGKPLINCYRLTHQLEFSGAVLSQEVANFLWDSLNAQEGESFVKMRAELKKLVPTYLVPIKGDEKHFSIINWIHVDEKSGIPDVRQYVSNSFFSHNKDISQAAMGKLNNTEMMIRFLIELYRKKT